MVAFCLLVYPSSELFTPGLSNLWPGLTHKGLSHSPQAPAGCFVPLTPIVPAAIAAKVSRLPFPSLSSALCTYPRRQGGAMWHAMGSWGWAQGCTGAGREGCCECTMWIVGCRHAVQWWWWIPPWVHGEAGMREWSAGVVNVIHGLGGAAQGTCNPRCLEVNSPGLSYSCRRTL